MRSRKQGKKRKLFLCIQLERRSLFGKCGWILLKGLASNALCFLANKAFKILGEITIKTELLRRKRNSDKKMSCVITMSFYFILYRRQFNQQ